MLTREGRRIKGGVPMDAVSPFIMSDRLGAANSFYASVDISKCEQLIKEKRAEGMRGLGMMHLFMATYVRAVSQRPGINRFIRGQRVFARNDIQICMTVKKGLSLNAPESVVKIFVSPQDTLTDIYEALTKEIDTNKHEGDQNSMDSLARLLIKLPRVFLKSTVGILRLFDYFGLLPRYLTNLSPFHGSMFISNLGSLGMPPVVHHLYSFGNIPLFITMGSKRTEYVLNSEGEVEKRRLIDFTFTCDDRICDGHYYASAFKLFKKLLENPEQLFDQPKTVIQDIR
jgi:hypothetical protein